MQAKHRRDLGCTVWDPPKIATAFEASKSILNRRSDEPPVSPVEDDPSDASRAPLPELSIAPFHLPLALILVT